MGTTASSGWKRQVHPRPGDSSRHTTARRAVLLVMASILCGLLLCEAGLRLFARFNGTHSRSGANAAKTGMSPSSAMRYIMRLPAAPGTDRGWFLEDPPPLPNRTAVDPQRWDLYRDFERRGIFTPQADYLWNRFYVESQRCAPNSVFQTYPDTVLAFSPPVEDLNPRYRFPRNTTMGSGLVTNEFGLRGPPIALVKPPKTIRIAFLGASTTVGFHYFPFSYPERVTHWLNRFAEANRLDVRFEALNAGREGINSQDIASIVRDELLPLDPDLAVYYEGSNQFHAANLLVAPPIPTRRELDPHDSVVEHKVPELLRTHLALGDLLDRALNGFGTLGEPRKPAYRLQWPAGVDEFKPALDNPHLPLQLPTIVKDLDSIRGSLASVGGQLVLCSFEWLVKDGMRFKPHPHEFIYKQLNTTLWPLRYADIRGLADFQNRVLRRYAADRGISFLDVASAIPQDPDLFSDAIHMTDPGERVRAWIVFQQLLPVIRKQIEAGKLPRAGGSHPLPPPPSLAATEASVRCGNGPSGRLERIVDGLPLDNIDLAYEGASIERGASVKVVTANLPWSFAATIPINAPAGLTRPCYLFLRARVAAGKIGLGIVDLGSGTLETEKAVGPTASMIDITVPVLFPDRAVSLIIRNAAPAGVRSEISIQDAALLAFLKPLPEETVKTVDLKLLHSEGRGAALERGPEGLRVTTASGQGAFAGRAGLGLGAQAREHLRVHVSIRTLEGKVGVGILDPSGKTFMLERTAMPSPHPIQLSLPLPSPPLIGDLIVRNVAAGNIISKAIIERIEIRKAP